MYTLDMQLLNPVELCKTNLGPLVYVSVKVLSKVNKFPTLDTECKYQVS